MCRQVIYPAAVLKITKNEVEAKKFLDYLKTADAMKVFEDKNIELEDVNMNIRWEGATHDNARKVFADYFIDDHSVGMKYKIVENKFGEKCKVCDWRFIDEWFVSEGLYNERVFKCKCSILFKC